MNLTIIDHLLARVAHNASAVVKSLGDFETGRLRRQLESIDIARPVFLTGLARSGTTILLQELAATGLFATHRYRDFPFVMTPCAWNWFVVRFGQQQPPVGRPHNDRIEISPDSPEAFEEPIWQHFFPDAHAPAAIHRLGEDTRHERFERFFKDHLRKIMLLRCKMRYLSKGNYNLARIEYLAKIFPDARFVIPVRHPLTQVASLVRQHELFCGYAQRDMRVARHLAYCGHYEFGPQRIPIRLTAEEGAQTADAWRQGRQHLGYALQWAQLYRHVDQLRGNPELAPRMLIVRHEDFCADPRRSLAAILQHAGVDAEIALAGQSFAHIAAAKNPSDGLSPETHAEIRNAAEPAAKQFGYEFADVEAPQQELAPV